MAHMVGGASCKVKSESPRLAEGSASSGLDFWFIV